MKNSSITPLLCAALALPIAGAVAAPAPRLALTNASACKRNDLLYHFDMIPGSEFAGFGGVNWRSLLKRKGAIVDNARKYIMIPGSTDPQDGNLRMVQISLFGSGEPLVAVSRVMWDNPSGKISTLRFYYGYADGGPVMRAAAERVFPYELGDGTTLTFHVAAPLSKRWIRRGNRKWPLTASTTKRCAFTRTTEPLSVMKFISLLAFGGTLCVVSAANAAPAPKLAATSVCKTDKNSELYKMFNRLPTYVLRNFGNMERYKLIDDDLITFDKANGFIEIPYKGRSNHPDRDKFDSFQMKVFRDNKGAPVLVVNSLIFSEPGVKPFLHVFRFAKNGDLVRTTDRDFPFKPNSIVLDRGRIYYNYELPKKGNVIGSGPPESDGYGYSYRWTGSRFVQTVEETDEGDGGHGRPPGF